MLQALVRYIYIPIWLDLLFSFQALLSHCVKYLHSNMVRFIIKYLQVAKRRSQRFTFQYGQIYYARSNNNDYIYNSIYIPIWLDLLYKQRMPTMLGVTDLHSNMVRFIIRRKRNKKSALSLFTFQYGQIYYRQEVSEFARL